MKKKWTIVLIVSLIAFVVGALLAHLFLLPGLVKREARKLALERGVHLDVGKISMVGTAFRLTDVILCSTDCGPDDPLVVHVDLLKVTPNLGSLLRGHPRPSSIAVSHARVRVDLTRPSALSAFSAAPRSGSSSDGERTEGEGGVGDTKSSGFDLPKIRAEGLELQVKVTDGIDATFEDGNILIDDDSAPALDLGKARVTAPTWQVEAQHVIVDLATPEEEGMIRTVRLVNPVIQAQMDLGDVSVRDEAPDAEQSPSEEKPEHSALQSLLARVDVVGLMAAVPDGALALFPSPRVEVNGGSLLLSTSSAEPVVEASKLKGYVSVDLVGDALEMNLGGDVDQGPFLLDVRMDDTALELEADTPYVPLGKFAGLVPVPQAIVLDDARIMMAGKGTLVRDSGTATFDGLLGGDGITVDSPKIALQPVTDVHFRFEGHAEVDPETKTIEITGSELDACGIPVTLGEARVTRLEDGFQIRAQGNVSRTRCQDLFNSLPFALRSSLPGFLFEGELSAKFNLDLDWSHVDDAVMDVELDNQCRVVSGGDLQLAKFSGTFVHNVTDKVGEHEFLMGPGSDSWVNLEEIAEHMPHALVTCEDGAFYKHKGISAFAIKRAVKKNIKKGYFAYGASTITMQLVKNLFLTRDKTISRKLQELIITWWVENSMDKDQIIELYLNVVEFGPAIYGIKNASMLYFGKHPIDLDLLECAFLAKMLPNPVSRYRYYEKGRNGLDPSWRAVLDRVVGKMFERGYITKEEYDEAIATPFQFYYPDMALDAPPQGGEAMDADESMAPDAVYVPATATSPFPDFSGKDED